MLFSCMKFFLPIVFLLGFCGAAAQTKQAMKNLKQQMGRFSTSAERPKDLRKRVVSELCSSSAEVAQI